MVTSALKERNEAVAFVPAAQDPELASWHLQGQLAKEKEWGAELQSRAIVATRAHRKVEKELLLSQAREKKLEGELTKAEAEAQDGDEEEEAVKAQVVHLMAEATRIKMVNKEVRQEMEK